MDEAFGDDGRAHGAGLDDGLAEAARIVLSAKRLIAFTGAGVSADSGVPTFRGKGGLWGSYDQSHLELGFFMREPAVAWKTIREIFYAFTLAVEPNDAHRVLALWEAAGLLSLVVTQNIDGLHSRAGSKAVAEFHGSCDRLRCTRCGLETAATRESVAGDPPRCACGGVLKPGFVFFGEGIPEDAYRSSFEAAEAADVCLVIGSTGEVFPAASVPLTVKRRGGTIIEINPERSAFTDSVTDVYLPLGAAAAMRRLDGLVRPGAGSVRPDARGG